MDDPAGQNDPQFAEARPRLTVEEAPSIDINTHIPPTEHVPPPFPGNPNRQTVQPAEFALPPEPVPQAHPPQDAGHTAVLKHGRGHKTSPVLFLIPAVVIIGVLVAATVIVRNYMLTQKAAIPQATPTSAPTAEPALAMPSPTPLPVIQLKEYSNPELLFSFKYPETLVTSPTDNGVELYTEAITQVEEESTETAEPISPEIRITVSENGQETSPNAVEFQGSDQVYTIELLVEESRANYQIVVETFEVLVDTSKWVTYSDPKVGYTINHPPEWIASFPTGTSLEVRIQKAEEETLLQNLVIAYQEGLTNAQLTANEAISSTRNLSGWRERPDVSLRNFGPANAQVIEGELSGRFSVFVIVWYRGQLIQMTWNDDVDETHGAIFEAMLSSLTIL